MQNFVIQEHIQKNSCHWDLMLQQENALITWQIPLCPSQWHGKPVPCRKIFDHRLKYLTYEGPLSQNRGFVKIYAAGNYQILDSAKNYWRINLHSDNIRGNMTLEGVQDDQWQLCWQGESGE